MRIRSFLRAIRELYDKNKGIDAVTLAEELKAAGNSSKSVVTTRSPRL